MRALFSFALALVLTAPLAAQPAETDSTVAAIEQAATARFEGEIARIESEARALRDRVAQQDQQIDRINALEGQIALAERRDRAERNRFFNVARVKYQRGFDVLRDIESNTRALQGQALVTDFFGTVLELTDPTTYEGFDTAFADIRRELRDDRARTWFDQLVSRIGLTSDAAVAVGGFVPQIDAASRALGTARSVVSGLFGQSSRRVDDLQRLERVECALHAIDQLHADLRSLSASNAALLPQFTSVLATSGGTRRSYMQSLTGEPAPLPAPPEFFRAVNGAFQTAIDDGGAESLALYDRVERTLLDTEAAMLEYHIGVRAYLGYWERMRASLVARRDDPCVVGQQAVRQRYSLAIDKVDTITRTVEQNYLFRSTEPANAHHEYYRLVTGRFTPLLGSQGL
ncbi:hypothetical protein [Rubricoccus marinus]|uniref:Uncharacterized protein n=1 Tax=Rubricoccus marinus TaxID=716817 RepID=A0A259U0U9_9BACT|nr:hypothetical protein [Rubricoccus marinus]OZC03653.1 hypothetical protein BSZ36_12065 [Rubricoccus marinus]